jgi:putative ABC transport system substrate-binding protein
MKRRTFIAALGSAAAWPLVAQAQQTGMPVVGVLVGYANDVSAEVGAFRQGLNEAGYFDGRNVMVETRFADGHFDRLPMLAAELVERKVDVLASMGGGLTAATAATKTIHVVALFASDPAKAGLVVSDNRPGGNVTGVNMLAASLGPKRFEVLHELLPKVDLIAVLANQTMPNPAVKVDLNGIVVAAQEVGQQPSVFYASTEREFEPAFAAMSQRGAKGLLVMTDPFFFQSPRANCVAGRALFNSRCV